VGDINGMWKSPQGHRARIDKRSKKILQPTKETIRRRKKKGLKKTKTLERCMIWRVVGASDVHKIGRKNEKIKGDRLKWERPKT